MDTSHLGTLGLATAIKYFVENGYLVSVPLIDAQPYDLIVERKWLDKFYTVQRVQVKYSSHRNEWGQFQVSLRSSAYGKTSKYFERDRVEVLFVVTPEGNYLIPIEGIEATAGIVMGPKYQQYKLGN